MDEAVLLINDAASLANDAASISANSHYAAASSYIIHDQRETMNRILLEANLSPIRSQTRRPLRKQSKSGLRRLVSKLTRATNAFRGIFQ